MTVKISSDKPLPLTLCETDEQKRILQNLALLFSTKKGTCPMYRDFGIPMEYVDKPQNIAEVTAFTEVIEAAAVWEPTAVIRAVNIIYDAENIGKFVMEVEVTL